jgi:hypothetical protein
MIELSGTKLILAIREFEDPSADTQRCWIVDIMDDTGYCVEEAVGVSSSLPESIKEAANDIALYLNDQWSMPKGSS